MFFAILPFPPPKDACCTMTSDRAADLGQHRIMGQGDSAEDFDPSESMGVHPVFPHFPYFRSGQNLSPNLLAPLCGVAFPFTRLRQGG